MPAGSFVQRSRCRLDEAAGFFGSSLELRAFRFNRETTAWDDMGVVHPNAINNFPPQKLPDGNLAALFRDNAQSGFVFRPFSTDVGRTWSPPVKTNFPDARSKLHGIRLSDGRYALVSNSNPRRRDPLTLALSDDGLVFNKLYYLVGGRAVDYPHMMEHDGHLYISHTGPKRSVKIEIVRLADLDALRMLAGRLSSPAAQP